MNKMSETLRDEYRIRFKENAHYRNKVWKILCRHYFQRFIPSTAHIIDLGSGWGEFINNINAARKLAMDLNPDAGPQLNDDVEFLHQDCSTTWQVPSQSLDVVFTSNFLEHLASKQAVEDTIAQAHQSLKPEGLLICLGPNAKHVPGSYWDFWDHYVPITERSLCELLRLTGFSIQLVVPRFLPYSMSRGWTPPLFLVRWYLVLPQFWPVFGKQYLVIGRK